MELTNTPHTAPSLNELQFKALVTHSHDGIVVLGVNGLVAYASPSVEPMWGFTQEELIGLNPAQYTHPDDVEQVVAELQNLMLQPGKTINLKYRMLTKAGQEFWVESNITNSLDVEGIEGLVFNYRNITEQHQTQCQLALTRQNRDSLINSIPDIIWSIDVNYKLVDANIAFYNHVLALTGKPLRPGMPIAEKHTKEDIATQWHSYYQMALMGKQFVEHLYFNRAGWHEVTFSPIHTNGTVTGVACYAKDINERRNTEERMRQLQHNMAHAQRIAGVGSWEFDLQQYRSTWSEEAYRICGYKPYSVAPSFEAFLNRVHPDDYQLAKEAPEKAIATQSGFAIEHRLLMPDGQVKWVASEAEVIIDPISGKPLKIIGTNQDITARKLADEKMVEMRRNRDALLNSIPGPVWSVDNGLILLDANTDFYSSYQQFTGFKMEPGMHIINDMHFDADRRERWRHRFETALAGQPYFEEIYISELNIGWVELTLNPIMQDGVVAGVVAHLKNITKRKNADEKMAQMRRHRDALLNSISGLVWSVNKDLVLLDGNNEFYNIYHKVTNHTIAPGMHIINDAQLPADVVEMWAKRFKTALQGQPYFEEAYLTNTGWVEIALNPIMDGDAVAGVVAYVKDINARKLAENEMTELRRNRDALVNNIPDPMWSVDMENNLIDGNRAFYNAIYTITGKALMPGQNFLSGGFNATETKLWGNLYSRALKGETVNDEVYIALNNTGWVEVTFSPIVDGDKQVGVACYAKNITERKRNIEMVKLSEQRMANAQRMAQIGSWEMELSDGDIYAAPAVWSDEVYRILCYNKEEVTPTLQDFLNRVHPDDLAFVLATLSNGITNKLNASVTYRIICPGGSIKWIESEGEAVLDENSNIIRIAGTHRDITDAKLFELEREKISADLVMRNKQLEQFAFIVSHNLRGPVSNIIGLSNELHCMDQSDEMYPVFMRECRNSVEKLDEVIKDLSYILQRKREISEQKEVVVFDELVDDIKNSISNLIREHNVAITTNFAAEPQITTLKTYLYSIFYNLISNSIKYRQNCVTPHIQIESRTQGDYIELQFTDNGIGIDLEKFGGTVFGLYKRFHTHTEGKGMGLYMAKSQVESLGGTISVTSKINVGTQFIIRLKK